MGDRPRLAQAPGSQPSIARSGERVDGLGRGQRPGHALAGERLDVAGRVAEQEHALAGDRPGPRVRATVPRQSASPSAGTAGKPGPTSTRAAATAGPPQARRKSPLERRRHVQAAVLDADQADVPPFPPP